MPPVPRNQSKLAGIVGEHVHPHILQHFLRKNKNDVEAATNDYYEWKSQQPEQEWPEGVRPPPNSPASTASSASSAPSSPAATSSSARKKRGRGKLQAVEEEEEEKGASRSSKRQKGASEAKEEQEQAAEAKPEGTAEEETTEKKESAQQDGSTAFPPPAPLPPPVAVSARSKRKRGGPPTSPASITSPVIAASASPVPSVLPPAAAPAVPVEPVVGVVSPFSSSSTTFASFQVPPAASPLLQSSPPGQPKGSPFPTSGSSVATIASSSPRAATRGVPVVGILTPPSSQSQPAAEASPVLTQSPLVQGSPVPTAFPAPAAVPFSPVPTAAAVPPSPMPTASAASPASPSFQSAASLSAAAAAISSPVRRRGVGLGRGGSGSGGRSLLPRSSHTTSAKPSPLPLPLPVEEEEDEEMGVSPSPSPDEADGLDGSLSFTSGTNLSAAFSAAAAIPHNGEVSGFSAPTLLKGVSAQQLSFSKSKPFRPPGRIQKTASNSSAAASSSAAVAATAASPSASSASSAAPSSSPSLSPPSTDFISQRVRNRHKYSSLDSLISGLEEEVSRASSSPVEPDVMKEAVEGALEGFSKAQMGVEEIKQDRAQKEAPAAAAAAVASKLLSRPRIRFTSSTQLQQHLLTLFQHRCCVPVTAAALVEQLSRDYIDVTEQAVTAQLEKLVQAGKIECKTFEIETEDEEEQEEGEDKERKEKEEADGKEESKPRRVEFIWLQPMELPVLPVDSSEEAKEQPSDGVYVPSSPAPTPAATPAPSPAAASSPPVTPLKASPKVTPASAAGSSSSSPTLSSTPSSSSVLSTPVSSTNHLNKTSSALKARLIRSRGRRPALLQVGTAGAGAATEPASTSAAVTPPQEENKTPAKTPWTLLAAAAATPATPANAPTTPAPSAAASSATLTPDQKAAIEAKKEAALRRRSLLTPLSKQAGATLTGSARFVSPSASSPLAAAPPTPLSPTSHLRAQLRSKQQTVAKLRDAKFISVDSAQTASTEVLTEKWTVAAQEVLTDLLGKAQHSRPMTMDQLIREFGIDPKQVRWNDTLGDFE